MPPGVAGLRTRRGRHCPLIRLSNGWCPADTGDAQEALDAAEAEIVSDCEFTGGGSGAVSARHGLDHVIGESFAKALRVNSTEGSAIAAGTIRGAQLGIGKNRPRI